VPQFLPVFHRRKQPNIRALCNKFYWWFQDSTEVHMRSSFLCNDTRRRFVVSYWRFGTTYRSHLQRSSKSRRIFLDCLILRDGTYGLSLNFGYQSTLRNIREERRPYVLIRIQCNTLFMMRICSLTCQTSQLKHFPLRLYGSTYSLSDTLHTFREPPVSGIKLWHSSLWPVTFCSSFSSEKCELLCVMLLIKFFVYNSQETFFAKAD
jgi:hypothetical protein